MTLSVQQWGNGLIEDGIAHTTEYYAVLKNGLWGVLNYMWNTHLKSNIKHYIWNEIDYVKCICIKLRLEEKSLNC